jgi:hypothetical protein
VRQHLKQSIFSSRPAPFSTRAAVKFGQEERKQAKHARNLVLKLRTRDLNTKRPSGRAALSFHCARLKWKNAADTYIDGEKETFACSASSRFCRRRMLGPAHQRFPFLFAAFISQQQQMYANRGGYLPAACFLFPLFILFLPLAMAGEKV